MLKKLKLLLELNKLRKQISQLKITDAMKNALLKNWKTTAAGLAMVILTALVQANIIDTSMAGTITTILTALGFAVSKDHTA